MPRNSQPTSSLFRVAGLSGARRTFRLYEVRARELASRVIAPVRARPRATVHKLDSDEGSAAAEDDSLNSVVYV